MASLNSLTGTLGHRRAAHLLRRTSFRYTKAKVDSLAGMTADAALTNLMTPPVLSLAQPIYDDPNTSVVESTTWINPPGLSQPAQDFELQRRVIGWWLNEALRDSGMTHKMAFFFHQYLAVAANTANNLVFFDYLALLRWGALGNFKKLATKMVVDNLMLLYLNNNTNTKTSPNENFAREFLELFTIGKGPQIGPGDYTNYTEDDIVQAARVLTGWVTRYNRDQVDTETGIPHGVANISRHDTGNKTFSSKFQNTIITGGTTSSGMSTELNNFVNMIFNQVETARNLCRRLYRYFVHRNISDEIETDIIVPLADDLKNNGYNVGPVLKKLLSSQHFYDTDDSNNADEIVGGMIKSPLELSLQALSFFNITIPSPVSANYNHYIVFYSSAVIDRMLGLANLPAFNPSDVAGYAAYHQEPDYSRRWFDATTIIARYKLAEMLLTGKRVIGSGTNTSIAIKLDIAPWVRDSGISNDPSDSYVLVKDLLDYMLPEEPDSDRFDYFHIEVFLDNLPPADWTYEWQHYLSTGDASEVKLALERLIKYIMFSPEYQTF